MALTRCVSDTDAKHLCKMIELRLRRDNVERAIANSNYAGTTLKIALTRERTGARQVRRRLSLTCRCHDTHIRPFSRPKLECVTT